MPWSLRWKPQNSYFNKHGEAYSMTIIKWIYWLGPYGICFQKCLPMDLPCTLQNRFCFHLPAHNLCYNTYSFPIVSLEGMQVMHIKGNRICPSVLLNDIIGAHLDWDTSHWRVNSWWHSFLEAISKKPQNWIWMWRIPIAWKLEPVVRCQVIQLMLKLIL